MKKLTGKLIFDLCMTIIWIVLMIYSLTGAWWHEALGLGIFALFMVHIGFNFNRARKELPRMFNGDAKAILRYILAILLSVGIVITVLSGVLISKDILTSIEASNLVFWTAVHDWAAYLTLILIGIHIGMHAKMIGAVIVRPLRNHPEAITWLRRGWNVAAAFLMVIGTIASFNYQLPAFAKAEASPAETPESDTLIEAPESPSNLMTIAATYPSGEQDYQADAQSGQTYQLTASDDETLEEYLGSQVCTFCHRCCPLTALQCSRGQTALEQATQEYYANHSDSNSSEDNGSEEISPDDNTSDLPDNADEDVPDDVTDATLPDILSIMGLYVGGTYYVSRISEARNKRRRL